MPRKRTARKQVSVGEVQAEPGNAKVCEACGHANSFKRVKCEKCYTLLPEGNFERARRQREQTLRREQQLALSSTLFTDRPTILDELEDVGDVVGGPAGSAPKNAGGKRAPDLVEQPLADDRKDGGHVPASARENAIEDD